MSGKTICPECDGEGGYHWDDWIPASFEAEENDGGWFDSWYECSLCKGDGVVEDNEDKETKRENDGNERTGTS